MQQSTREWLKQAEQALERPADDPEYDGLSLTEWASAVSQKVSETIGLDGAIEHDNLLELYLLSAGYANKRLLPR